MKKNLLFSAVTLSILFLAVGMSGCGSSGTGFVLPTPTPTPAPTPTTAPTDPNLFAFLRTDGTATPMSQQQLQTARRAAKIHHATMRQAAITADPTPVNIYVWPLASGTERKITGSPGAYTSVHLSLNNTSLVFSKIVSGYNQIFASTLPAEGQTAGVPIQLTADTEHHWVPHISADGSKVAFTKFDANSNGDVVCVINNIAGATETCLDFSFATPVLAGANIWHASWAPDGKIFFEAWGGPFNADDIFMVNADGSGLTQITNNAGTSNYDECPSVKPDGNFMVVGTWNDTSQYYEIARIDLNTKQRATIISGTYTHGDAWDPLYTSTFVWVSQLETDHSPQLYMMSFSPLRLTSNLYANYFESSPQ